MTTAHLSPVLAEHADQAGLGRFVGTLTPPVASALRTVGTGVVATAMAAAIAIAVRPTGGWSVTGLVVLGVVGLGFLVVGVIELLPGPGRVFLFEDGLIRVGADGTVETVSRLPELPKHRGHLGDVPEQGARSWGRTAAWQRVTWAEHDLDDIA